MYSNTNNNIVNIIILYFRKHNHEKKDMKPKFGPVVLTVVSVLGFYTWINTAVALLGCYS